MKTSNFNLLRENIQLYKRTVWIRLPGILLVGSILAQHDKPFNYIGFSFVGWVVIEIIVLILNLIVKK